MRDRMRLRKLMGDKALRPVNPFLRFPAVKALAARAGEIRGRDVANQVERFIPPNSSVLDLGCGLGFVAEELLNRGHRVVGVDKFDIRLTTGFEFMQGSAYSLPFEDDSFDVCLLHTVLHHLYFPDDALREARRIARRTVVGEELRICGLNWWLLRNYDNFVNLSFQNNPNSNRSHADWIETFESLEFQVDHVLETRVFGFIHQVIYSLGRGK